MTNKLTALLRSSLIYGLGNYGVKLVGFLLIPVYTRYLHPADYGIMALVATFGQALFIFLNLGQSSALFRFYYEDDTPEGRKRVIAGSLWIVLLISTPVTLLALGLSRPTAYWLLGDVNLWTFVAIGVLTVACRQLVRLPFAVMRANERDRQYASWSIFRTALSAGLAILLVVGFQMGVLGVLLSSLAAEGLCCVILVPGIGGALRAGWVGEETRAQLGFGLALVPGAMASFVLDLSDRFFLKQYASLDEVGLYSLGYRLGEIIFFVAAAVQLAWPQFVFSNRRAPEAKALYAYATTYFLVGMLFLILGLSMLAPEAIRLMAPPAYQAAAIVVPFIALSGLAEGLRFVATIGVMLQRRPLIRSVAMGIAATVNIVLNVLLIPRFGTLGAAGATLVGFAVLIAIEMTVSLRVYPIPYQWGRFAKIAAVASGLFIASLLLPAATLPVVIACKLGLLASFPVLLWMTRFFEPSELAQIRRAGAEVARRLTPSRA